MTEFHKKESEELERDHEKLYELLEEDKKKVCLNFIFKELICWHSTIDLSPNPRYLGFWSRGNERAVFQAIRHLIFEVSFYFIQVRSKKPTLRSKYSKFHCISEHLTNPTLTLWLLFQSLKDLRTLHETKLKHLSVCELELTYASLFGDKVTKL